MSGSRKAAVLRGHGFHTIGPAVDAAAWWLVSMDDAAYAQILAESVGAGRPRSRDRRARPGRSGPIAAALSFRPLSDKIVADGPDLLD